MSQQAQVHGQSDITADEVRSELELVLCSPAFLRSEKLQAFLKFVCETTLQGSAAEINEYLIGSKVFRRGEKYNPSEDSIVRRHAHAMRQKLQEYYSTEGAGHAIRIEMPVGRYVPVFRRREEVVADVPVPSVPAPAVPLDAQPQSRRASLLIAAVGVFALGWCAAYFSLRETIPMPRSKTLAGVSDIWDPWIASQAVICFSNPTSVSLRHFPGQVNRDIAAHTVRAQPDQEKLFREKFSFASGGGLYFFPTIAQTMMGEASSATHLATLFAQTGIPLRTMENRFLSWEALRRDNYVILGGDVENHWVDAILEKYPLRINAPNDGSPRAIVNTAPKAGEQSAFYVVGSAETREEYSLISMSPGIAENHQLLLICGLNSPAVPSATELLTTAKGLRDLSERLRNLSPAHLGPWHFQVVIKADVRDKVPTTSSVVALRVL